MKRNKVLYEPEDDVLNIWLSKKPIDYAEDENGVIIHYTENDEPVYIEIMDASRFFKAVRGMGQKSKFPVVIPHRIK